MFDQFDTFDREIGDQRIHGVIGGSGPPVLLLHGFPQTHVMWHPIVEDLAETHTVIATDLRGYGDSSRPPSDAEHSPYSFPAMAADQVALMRSFGFESFAVIGHDRGARVAHRMALDHRAAIRRLALIDILPTLHVYEHVDRFVATGYYHWFFFIQPYDVPERLIAGDPIPYLHSLLGGWGSAAGSFSAEAMREYERVFSDPAARHSMLEDYRAGASIDLEHDRADLDQPLDVPLLVLWGDSGVVGRSDHDPLEVWRTRGTDVAGAEIAGGHFLVEENPADCLRHLREFLG